MNRTRAYAWIVGVVACLTGCEPEDVDTGYGRRRGLMHEQSVNGTSVLASMFQQAGHRVSSRTALSPRTREADVIVWFPNDYAAPSEETVKWLKGWLAAGSDRTLVYVGRDYDAATAYWRRVLEKGSDRKSEILLKLAGAEHRAERVREMGEEECDWFLFVREKPPTPIEAKVKSLDGPWAEGIEGETWIELYDELVLLDDATPLLIADEQFVAASIEVPPPDRRYDYLYDEDPGYYHGRVIVIQNGSFLLNYPLVNRQHRRLAAHLIDETSPSDDRNVVFLESGANPAIMEQDPEARPPTLDDYPPPLSDILYHGIGLGVIVAMALYPIFGRPRETPPAAPSDFGKHVDSVAELLARTGDVAYCRRRVEQFKASAPNEKT